MNKVSATLGLLLVAVSFQAKANISDIMSCKNKDWKIDVGVNSVPDKTNTVHVALSDLIDGGTDFTASVSKKSNLDKELAKGLILSEDGTENKILVVIQGKTAKVAFEGNAVTMKCKTYGN
jgi:hypothetical protein